MLIFIVIIIYHLLINNNLEKMYCSTIYNYDNIKRPSNECNNNFIEPLSCNGLSISR